MSKTPRRTLSTAKIDLRSLCLAAGYIIKRYGVFPRNQSRLVHLIVEDHIVLHTWLEEKGVWKQFEQWQTDKLKEKALEAAANHLELSLLPERPVGGRPRSDFDLIEKPPLEEAIEALENWDILPNKRFTMGIDM